MNESELLDAKKRLTEALRGTGAHLRLEDAIENFPDSLINTVPPNVPYSFWHQIEHIRIAQQDLLLYATKPGYVSPAWPDGYWPKFATRADRHAWDETITAIQRDREAVIALINDPERDIFAPVKHMDNRTIFRAALLVVDHTAYHLGEFVMARQMLGHWQSELRR